MKAEKIANSWQILESTALYSIVLMWALPNGNFNPASVGFWSSIGLAVFIQVGARLFLKKYQQPKKV
ncbi:MAG: hypothetical protein ACOYXT_22175 [Bacteroidota bacterium]